MYQNHLDDQGSALTTATSRYFNERPRLHRCETVGAARFLAAGMATAASVVSRVWAARAAHLEAVAGATEEEDGTDITRVA